MNKKNKILLSFDVEEFDTPLDYQFPISEADQFRLSAEGTTALLDLLKEHQVKATFFTTANFALHQPALMQRMLQEGHEVASHGYYHTTFEEKDLLSSRVALEELLQIPIKGYRMARMAKLSEKAVADAGYAYNSSLHPTYLPGRYNNFFKKRRYYLSEGILQIPASVVPLVRFPLFWLAFKNFPLWFIQWASKQTLYYDGYLNLYYHPWEFVDIRNYGLPSYVRRFSENNQLIERLSKYIVFLKKHGEFSTFQTFIEQLPLKQS
ncbi:MAG: DUF3473 domain-containing protein [Cytophagales bacterium]|nr:MAG: DUF3473 domain-containing protein [Cytophagales bacterium]